MKLSSVKGIGLFITGFFVVWSIRAIYLYSIDETIASPVLRAIYSNTVKLLLWDVSAFGFVYWVRHASPFHYLGLSHMPTARQWLSYLCIIGLFLGAIIGFEVFIGISALSLGAISVAVTIPNILSYLVSPTIEEILFRGLFLKELASLMPHWCANLVTSLLFAGIHLPYWLSHGGLSETVIANTVGVLIFSLVAGWLYLRSTSLWPSVVAHIANNYVVALL
jgi:membrane protease YdiL (CAAX protease family)